MSSKETVCLQRRGFLLTGAATVGACALPQAVWAGNRKKSIISTEADRTLGFYNTHTGEEISATFWADGHYIKDGLREINRVLRDHRNDEIHLIDPRLLSSLHALQHRLGSRAAIHVISAYRSPATNRLLRSKSRGVAKKSLHMQGKAVDIRLPDVSLSTLRRAALSLRSGGVGYYSRSNFVHMDVGSVRSWGR